MINIIDLISDPCGYCNESYGCSHCKWTGRELNSSGRELIDFLKVLLLDEKEFKEKVREILRGI